MGLWNAASDCDYFEECNRPRRCWTGKCADCGEPVYVSRDQEPPIGNVWCDICEHRRFAESERERAAVNAKAKGDAA